MYFYFIYCFKLMIGCVVHCFPCSQQRKWTESVALDLEALVRCHAGFIFIADGWTEGRLPRDTLAPVCEGVDDLMKMSHFTCQIIWHLFCAPIVRDSRVGALVWWAALSDWQQGPVSMTEKGSTSLMCFDRTSTWFSLTLEILCIAEGIATYGKT